jgi:EAL domain-containing protein (putative c-di-GMP-specific phosphodiesterase class I)
VALDDFGTAYSSLSYLQKYSFNKVKIDKSFVRGMFDIPADLAVVRAIVGIGRDLGIEIIAEGVENRMQMERLAREGCKRMQGFYFAKPKPLSEVCADLALAQMSPLLEQEEAAPAWRSRRY